MKKIISSLIVVAMLLSSLAILSSCSGNSTSNSDIGNSDSIKAFSENVAGVWMLQEDDNPYASVSFLTISEDMNMTSGVYPGSCGRTCEITEIHSKNDGSFQAVLYYPATEATDMDDAMPEYRENVVFSSDDTFLSSFVIEHDSGQKREYKYMSTDFDKARKEFDQIIEEKQQDAFESSIPTISANSTILDADFETLKIRMGYDLSGPNDSWRSNSESIFYLKNMEDVDCYMNISSKEELLGVKNGDIVFYGIYGLLSSSVRVKDFLPNDALTTTPAVYTIRANTASRAGLDSYVWRLDNGYMAIIVVPRNMNFYDQYVYNVAYVTDLDYLSYIGY